MSINLTIDRGNTLTKLAVWRGDELLTAEAFESTDVDAMASFAADYEVDNALMCSVAGSLPRLAALLAEKGVELKELSAETSLPITIDYETPSTLGTDRIAAVVGAWAMMPGRDVLVVDAGTAVTYEHLTASGCFAGGNIAPGVDMRLRALHAFTKRLPEVAASEAAPTDWGLNTRQAMVNGAVNGILAETLYYRSLLPPASAIVITGGDGESLASRFEFRVFYEPHLVTLGLNAIINFNNQPLNI